MSAQIETFESASSMPNNIDAERALLGALILDNSRIDETLERIPTEALRQSREAQDGRRPWGRGQQLQAEPLFFLAGHQMVFSAILTLRESAAGVDLTTLAEELLRRGQLELAGGAPFLAGLEDDIFALTQVPQYADIVVQKWRLRCLIRASQAVIEEATHSQDSASIVIDRAEKRIFDIGMANKSADFVLAGDVLPDYVQAVEERAKGSRGIPGLATGFTRFDQMTNGLKAAQLIILAARPSMGKSASALNVAANIALRFRKPVGFFTLEMSREELIGRLIATESRVGMTRMQNGRDLRRHDLDAIHEAAARIDQAPLYINESSSLTVLEMRAQARRLKSRCPDLALIIVDYLQLMSGGGRRYDNRQAEVSEISRSLKVLSGELKVPVIALSQLSRDSEKRPRKERFPRLSDLRDSGAIEQDADIVVFIHREKDQQRESRWILRQEPEEAIWILAKHRNGPIGNIDMLFRGEYAEFVDLARES